MKYDQFKQCLQEWKDSKYGCEENLLLLSEESYEELIQDIKSQGISLNYDVELVPGAKCEIDKTWLFIQEACWAR